MFSKITSRDELRHEKLPLDIPIGDISSPSRVSQASGPEW